MGGGREGWEREETGGVDPRIFSGDEKGNCLDKFWEGICEKDRREYGVSLLGAAEWEKEVGDGFEWEAVRNLDR